MAMTADEFRNYVREVPLLGGLIDCDGSDHWEALGQTFVVVLFSTAPIWLALLIVYGSGDNLAYGTLKAAMHDSIAKGELFMYCTALLAPIFWVALVDLPGARAFPSKISHMVLIALIDLAAALFFGLTSAGRHLNPVFTLKASTYMFLFSVGLLYLGTVYHVSRIAEATTDFRRQEAEFSDEMRRHRR